MRILMAVVIVAALAWGSLWFVGARAVEQGAEGWFEDQRLAGIEALHGGLAVRGFPNRFDLTVNTPRLSDPLTRTGWEAPFIQIFALSYRPNHIIAVWPHQQTLHLPFETVSVQSDDLRGSVVFGGGLALALRRSTFVGDNLWLRSDRGWQIGLDTLRLATRRTLTDADAHDLALEVLGLVPDPRWLERMPPDAAPPPRMEQVRLDLGLQFDAPIDRTMFGRDPVRLTGLKVNEMRATWGDMLIQGGGELEIGPNGQPEGSILLHIRDWRQMLDVAVAAGMVHPEIAETWARAMELMESEFAADGVLQVPLRFRGGRMSLGPMPLGAAPAFFPG